MSRRRRSTLIEIDVSDYMDVDVLDTVDAIFIRNSLEDARGCLNRPERTVSEAIEHIERALAVIAKAVR